MRKALLLPVLIVILASAAFPANLTLPKVALEGIPFTIKTDGVPDSIKMVTVVFTDGKGRLLEHRLSTVNGSIDTTISLNNTGNFKVLIKESELYKGELRVIPGLLSLIPPLLAILLALLLRQVIISLVLGIYIGAVFVYDYNPVTALLRLIDTYIINTLTDQSHIQIIIFTFLFGGVVGLISKSGGTRGIANVVTRFARTRRSGMLSAWFSGLLIFFDDYANTLIVGNLMRPITDRLKISREKLSFIVDATSAPVASLVIVSSWIGFEVGLIQDGLKIIGSQANAYDVFIQTIPFRFYPIAMLIFVFMLVFLKRDFGPMHKAELRAVTQGKVIRDGTTAARDLTETSDIFGNDDKAKWYNGIVPIIVLILVTLYALYYTGSSALREQGITDFGIRDIIANSNSYLALLWGSFSACIAAGVLIISQRIMNLSETVDAWFMGVRSMLLAQIILTLAWTIGSITVDVKTADYIISIISDNIDPRYLPVIIFLICALTSFATGTSWGTMAIMMPIVIPLAANITGLYNYTAADSQLIIYGVVSSVLAGSVFGDHCSPIADTTILSSMASGCDHMDHVRTQLPYALVTAAVCMLIGDLPTAFGFSPYLSILLISAVLLGIIFLFGKKAEAAI